MTTDYCDLITRMAKELDDYRQLLLDDRTVTHRLSNEARAVLAHWGNPAPAPPADGEVAELVEWLRSTGEGQPCLSDEGYARLTRAAELLQRQAPQPPADGEVAEVMGLFRRWAEAYPDSVIVDPCWLTRAAELLQRQALVPVSVSERPWEREGWCDVEGRFWAEHISRSGVASWRCAAASDLGGWAVRCLPAHALPLPEVGE